jgi:hypothetical protein
MPLIVRLLLAKGSGQSDADLRHSGSKVTHIWRIAPPNAVLSQPYFYALYFVSSKTQRQDQSCRWCVQLSGGPPAVRHWPPSLLRLACTDGSKGLRKRPSPARLQQGPIPPRPAATSTAVPSTPDFVIRSGTTFPMVLVDQKTTSNSCWRSRNCRARGRVWPGCARAGRASGPGGRHRSAASGRTASSSAPRPAD